MGNAVNFDLNKPGRLREFASRRHTSLVALLFALLLAAQAIGFLVLGTGRQGLGFNLSILVLDCLISLSCGWVAFRRAQGITALFWFLFTVDLGVLLVPTAFQAFDTVFGVTTLSDPTRNLLFCLYGAPILMMLFLPDTYGRERVQAEIVLDLFQIAIVVGLIYSTFVFLPVRTMSPPEALRHDVIVSDAQSVLLLIAAFIRLQFARIPGTRAALLRLVHFLLICAIATCVGDWIDQHHYEAASAWFNLGWAIPPIAAALLALSWTPSPEPSSVPEPTNFLGFLGTNLVLVAMLSCVALLTDRWKQAYGEVLTNTAIAASLVAFTFRLALTQFRQQQEIAERKAAQKQLIASNQQVGSLLDDSRRQTDEITQISELASLLQACSSREEVLRLIPDRFRRLFPGASGSVALISASKNRVESVVEWGMNCPADQLFSPQDCWALRRGCTHSHPQGTSSTRCAHMTGNGSSVCVPLIANGEAIGTLAIQNDETPSAMLDAEAAANSFARRRHLAAAAAEHIAVSIANLILREALRSQAVRDSLTGLYNRRYMQEFLDRELHSARRKRRPLAVMMLDLDHFKRYNDTFGHAAGDKALATVGETLLRCVRVEDVACRYGGEEFTLILPECSLQQATLRADEIRKRLREAPPPRDCQATTPITVSIGVAAFDETTDRVDLLLKFADDALFEAKRAGRDRVVTARPAAATAEPDFIADAPSSATAKA